METETAQLKAVWDAIAEKADPGTSFESFIRVNKRVRKWLRAYQEFSDEFQSLWVVELLEFVASHGSFSEIDVYRAAERARYAIRKAVKKSHKLIFDTEHLPSKADVSPTHTHKLLEEVYEVLKNLLNEEELVLLDSLISDRSAIPKNFAAKTLASKVHRLRRKIEPTVRALLGDESLKDS